jgi:hypothetical protein
MKRQCPKCGRKIGVIKKTGELARHRVRKGSRDHMVCPRETLPEKFLKRISEKPEILEELADRLENDPIVK